MHVLILEAAITPMNNRILIVDDDDDFRSLLSDLYIQADYQVKAVPSGLDALKLLNEETFSLCVTDQSMPELKGVDFIVKCREMKPNLPIIMVSAYLDEADTKRLQDLSVEVFHKPLNIMSLLRKTSELIKNASSVPQEKKSVEVFSNEEAAPAKPAAVSTQDFISYPLKSDASKRFKKDIESIGDEAPNIVLVGDEGTHFELICKDIQNQVDAEGHYFVFLTNPKINVFDISKMISGQPASKTLVFALIEAFAMGTAQKQALLKLHQKTGPFAGVHNSTKFIFCLHEDLDTQFAKGAIDQDFYLIMGQKEIYVPRLNLCKEDIPPIAEQIAEETANDSESKLTFSGFSNDAKELLEKTEWEFNYDSLKAAVISALKHSGGQLIDANTLEKGIQSPATIAAQQKETLEPIQHHDPKIHQGNESKEPEVNPKPSPKPFKRGKVNLPKIQSFGTLDDETELARSILKGK
jgi:DNA-binding NtrC family response regulator